MKFLFFSAEVPGYGGYLVGWHRHAPAVEQCRPVLEQLCLHEWPNNSPWVRRPAEERLSWRVIDHTGTCRVQRDTGEPGSAESAWLAALDLQLARGQLCAPHPESYLVLLAGRIRVEADEAFRQRLARAHHFLDYSLDFLGPAGDRLAEHPDATEGDYRFLEKHEGFVVEDQGGS